MRKHSMPGIEPGVQNIQLQRSLPTEPSNKGVHVREYRITRLTFLFPACTYQARAAPSYSHPPPLWLSLARPRRLPPRAEAVQTPCSGSDLRRPLINGGETRDTSWSAPLSPRRPPQRAARCEAECASPPQEKVAAAHPPSSTSGPWTGAICRPRESDVPARVRLRPGRAWGEVRP